MFIISHLAHSVAARNTDAETLKIVAWNIQKSSRCMLGVAILLQRLPDVLVLTETGFRDAGHRVAKDLIALLKEAGYNLWQNFCAITMAGGNSGGVLVAVKNTFKIVNVNDFHEVSIFRGRLLSVTIVHVNSDCGKSSYTTVVGVYAPCVAKGKTNTGSQFWSALSTVAKDLGEKYILTGDFNVLVNGLVESRPQMTKCDQESIGMAIRSSYLDFLLHSECEDIWSQTKPYIMSDYTHASSMVRGVIRYRILDRTATHGFLVGNVELRTIQREEGLGSDHRPIETIVQIALDGFSGLPRSRTRKTQKRTKMPDATQGRDRMRILNFVNAMGVSYEAFQIMDPSSESCTYCLFHHPKERECRFFPSHKVWDEAYRYLRKTTNELANKIFPPPRHKPNTRKVNTEKVIAMVKRIRATGRLLRSFKEGTTERVCRSKLVALEVIAIGKLSIESARFHRKELNRQLDKCQAFANWDIPAQNFRKQERHAVHHSKADKSDVRPCTAQDSTSSRNQKRSIAGTAFLDPDIIFSPRQNSTSANKDQDFEAIPKPWIEDLAFMENFAIKEQFIWPRFLNLHELEGLLHRGKRNPLPGPDLIERWWFRLLPERHHGRCLLLRLLNYVIQNNYFPPALTETELSQFWTGNGSWHSARNYKNKISRNLIWILSTQWAAFLLETHATSNKFIPALHRTPRSGISIPDLTSVVSQVNALVRRRNMRVYTSRRELAFGKYDCANFLSDCQQILNLPLALLKFECQRLQPRDDQVRNCDRMIASSDQVSRAFFGDPIRVISIVLLSALSRHWAKSMNDQDSIYIDAARGDEVCTPFQLRSLFTGHEDIQFCNTMQSLKLRIQHVVQVEEAYGVRGAYQDPEKASYTVLGFSAGENRPEEGMEIHTSSGIQSITYWPTLEIQNCACDHPELALQIVLQMIDEFQIPRLLGCTLPFGMIKNVIKDRLVPKIKARLELQCVAGKDAYRLDSAMLANIKKYYGLDIVPRYEYFLLSEHNGGEGLPAFEELNSRLAIGRLLRDFNHHDTSIQHISSLTYDDWRHSKNGIPAHNTCPLNLTQTYHTGKVTGMKFATIRSARNTIDIPKTYSINHSYFSQFRLRMIENPLKTNFEPFSTYKTEKINRQNVEAHTQAVAGHQARLREENWDAKIMLRQSLTLNTFPDQLEPPKDGSLVFVCDGSYNRATGIVGAAVTGHATGVARVISPAATAVHGEMAALAMGLTAGIEMSAGRSFTVFSDHEPSVYLLNEMRKQSFPRIKVGQLSARAFSWQVLLLKLYENAPNCNIIKVKSTHLSASRCQARLPSVELLLHAAADRLAYEATTGLIPAQQFHHRLLEYEEPFYLQTTDGIPRDQPINKLCYEIEQKNLWKLCESSKWGYVLDRSGYQSIKPVKSHKTQLDGQDFLIVALVKTRVLPVNALASALAQRGQLQADQISSQCLCCQASETLEHLFVECSAYDAVRNEHASILLRKLVTARHCREGLRGVQSLQFYVENLFRHSAIWPDQRCRYYDTLFPLLPDWQFPKLAIDTIVHEIIALVAHIWRLRQSMVSPNRGWDNHEIYFADVKREEFAPVSRERFRSPAVRFSRGDSLRAILLQLLVDPRTPEEPVVDINLNSDLTPPKGYSTSNDRTEAKATEAWLKTAPAKRKALDRAQRARLLHQLPLHVDQILQRWARTSNRQGNCLLEDSMDLSQLRLS